MSQAATATQAKAHWPGRGELRPRTHYEVGHSARSEPPDLDELRRRLTKRGTETPEQIELRLVNAAREMELWRDYRYTIISKSVEEDLMKFRHIMGAERYLSRRLILS